MLSCSISLYFSDLRRPTGCDFRVSWDACSYTIFSVMIVIQVNTKALAILNLRTHFRCIIECKVIKPQTFVYTLHKSAGESNAAQKLLPPWRPKVEECVLIKHYAGFRTGYEFSRFSCILCFQRTEWYVNPDVLFSAFSRCMMVRRQIYHLIQTCRSASIIVIKH